MSDLVMAPGGLHSTSVGYSSGTKLHTYLDSESGQMYITPDSPAETAQGSDSGIDSEEGNLGGQVDNDKIIDDTAGPHKDLTLTANVENDRETVSDIDRTLTLRVDSFEYSEEQLMIMTGELLPPYQDEPTNEQNYLKCKRKKGPIKRSTLVR